MTEKSEKISTILNPTGKKLILGGGRRPSFLPEDKHPDWKEKEQADQKDQQENK
ncbi:MAG: hypothetical protein KA066_01305 [Candidatus Pacebacteria bacterium]|nr:hypothetical protein [Candidatus Paceibacterota bacterium]